LILNLEPCTCTIRQQAEKIIFRKEQKGTKLWGKNERENRYNRKIKREGTLF